MSLGNDPLERDVQRIGRLLASDRVRAYNSANIPILNNTFTTILLNSERYDTNDMHSVTVNTNRLTAVTPGLYDGGGCVSFAANANGFRLLLIRVNGSAIISYDTRNAVTTAGIDTRVTLPFQYPLNAGEWIDMVVYQSSGVTLNVISGANYSPELWMARRL